MKNKITPNNITDLKDNEVFVFGSNLAGRHGAGAALLALNKFGAIYGQGVGIQGKSYGIPTKDENIKTMSVRDTKPYVDEFIEFAKLHSYNIFLVTEIGCGLAGHKPSDIAPLFEKALGVANIYLPERFI